MLNVKYLSCVHGELEIGNNPVVYPYYWNSFCALRCEEGTVRYWDTDNVQFLLGPVCRVSAHCNREIFSFLDVRTTEEYGAPAPEYLILDRAGMNHVNPLAIRGMDSLALPEALTIAKHQLQKTLDGQVLVCCSELPTPYEAQSGKRCGVAFVLDMEDSCDCSGITIKEFCTATSRQRLEEKLSRFDGMLIYSELPDFPSDWEHVRVIHGRSGMTEPLFLLDRMCTDGRRGEMLVLLESMGHYGFVHYQVGDGYENIR